MKKLWLLVALLLCLTVPCLAEENIATQIWTKMAEIANVDLAQCWEFSGIYTFGETTGDGYVTMTLGEDHSKLSGSISWRIYPDNSEEIMDQYFPMLHVLLEELELYNTTEQIDEWLSVQEMFAIHAYKDIVSYDTEVCSFELFDICIKYDPNYNELYCLLTATQDSLHFVQKKDQ